MNVELRPWKRSVETGFCSGLGVLVTIFLLLALASGTVRADGGPPAGSNGSVPELRTNQQFLEELAKSRAFNVEDNMAVFRFIFSRLADTVRAYPTENYYYFTFYHLSIKYAGNLRLAAVDRDQGILHFAYFADASASASEGDMHYIKLSPNEGVRVEKRGPLEYIVGFGGKQVTFKLNDVSDVTPPKGLLRDEETYIGPVFDESGIQFYLVFNTRLKIFHYILNETWGAPDRFVSSGASERILIGARSGFVFYKDHYIDRKILIAVHANNVRVNNYYDGPFDQLPDNFIKSDVLKDALVASDPSVAGQLDRYVYLSSGEGRYLIGPYMEYSDPEELAVFDTCASDPATSRDQYPRCFALQGGG